MHFPLPHHSALADWRRRLPAATEVVLVLALVLQGARIAWVFLSPTTPGTDAGVDAGVAMTTSPASDAAPASLPLIDVFFRSATPAASPDQAMGYRLFGVRRGGDGDSGSAILGKEDLQASYAVGREVAPGVVLESVGEDHAVLFAGGVRHRLELPGRNAPEAATPRRKAVRSAAGAAPASSAETAAASRAGTGVSTASADARSATRPTQSAPANPSPAAIDIGKLVAEAGLRPNLAGGFTLSPGGDAALLKQAGLAAGDVLLAVDGKPLNLASVSGLAAELQGRSEVELRYRRNGQVHTTTLKAPR
jgi:general secretion pathway protein C